MKRLIFGLDVAPRFQSIVNVIVRGLIHDGSGIVGALYCIFQFLWWIKGQFGHYEQFISRRILGPEQTCVREHHASEEYVDHYGCVEVLGTFQRQYSIEWNLTPVELDQTHFVDDVRKWIKHKANNVEYGHATWKGQNDEQRWHLTREVLLALIRWTMVEVLDFVLDT